MHSRSTPKSRRRPPLPNAELVTDIRALVADLPTYGFRRVYALCAVRPRWGADETEAEAFTEVAQEFRAGDRVQFTRNSYRADRLDGQTAEVVAIDTEGVSIVLQREEGTREMLDLAHLADRHVRPGWVRTIHSAQCATCDRVLAHLESFRVNTVDARSVYVAISRARMGAAVYTDSRASLTEAMGLRDGAQIGAIDQTMKVPAMATAILAPVNVVAMGVE